MQALPKERLESINQQQQASGTGLSVTVPGGQEDEERKKDPAGEESGKEGGLGPRWPKGMWDVMDSE